MFNSTTLFRSLIGNSGRVVKTKISYSDIDVTSEDVLQYFKFTDEIIDEKNSNYIGSFTGKKIVYTLMGDVLGFIFSSSDRWITVYQGILVDAVYEYIPQGKFKVIKAPQDKKTYDIEVEALDSSVLFDVKYSLPVAVWPMTVLQWTQAICAEVGVSLGSMSWFNSELILTTEPYLEGTFRDAIKIIAQTGASFAKIGRDDKLYFKNFSVVANLIENVFEYKVDETFGPVNSLLLTRDPTNDNVGIVDQVNIDLVGETQISIDNNPILDTDRETLITGLFNVIKGFNYQVIEVEYPGDPCIDVGDIITFRDDQDEVVSLTVLFSEIEDSGSWYGTVKAVAMSKTDANSDYLGSYDKRMSKTEIEVDKANQKILLTVSDISAINNAINGSNGLTTRIQVAEQKLTPNAITQTVEDTSTLLAKKSYVDQTAGAFALAVGETIRDEYGNTISNIQGNFIFTSGGMEIKMTGAEFSTFYAANRIEFRQNGNVLQWLSGNKNYMTDLIIVGNLALPKHKFETLANGHTVLRYIGG